MIHELDKRRSITLLIQTRHYSSHRVSKQMINFDLTQESTGSSHSWSSPLALDECVKQPKKTYKSPQVYDKSTYYINLAA